MFNTPKHEFASKQIKNVSCENDTMIINLTKGSFDVRKYLQLDDDYKLKMSKETQDRIEANGFNNLFIQYIQTHSSELGPLPFIGTGKLKRTVVTIVLGYEPVAANPDESFRFVYYK